VGTATAQLLNGEPFLHYIAVHKDWRGRGLAKPLMSHVLARHAELGRAGCYLTTDDHRLPAINSYLQFGWQPVLWSDDAQQRWEALYEQLGV
jgi:GNAT superfamily N-acetyltransferase